MKTAYKGPRVSTGLSLIELMIALLIGTILVLGLVQVFSASRTAYQLSQGIARNQESSRFAVDFLTRDLRMAGHAGCVNDQSLLSTDGTTITGGNIRSLFLNGANRNANNVAALLFPLRFDVSIQGYEANGTAPGNTRQIPAALVAGAAADWSPVLPADISGLNPAPIRGSDIVVLRFLSAEEAPITTFNATGTPAVVYPAASGALATGGSGLFAIADCRGASVFQASAAPTATSMNVTQTGLNASDLTFISTHDSSLAYKAGSASLYRAESMAYYVAFSPQAQAPALYRVRWISTPGNGALTAVTEEMVDGVESMQLLFGRDSAPLTSPPSGYISSMVPASTIGDETNAAAWRRVGAVQLGLMVRNSGNREGAAATQSLIPLSVLEVQMPVQTPDGNYRSVYETTVALRNRLYGN
ncbi:type IV pilus assembly protein PilW [Pseudoxanthomonas sp. CF125]|nr:type IV pilus assembly protein PilW [Pseudoxanthomonas sp. CF125]